MEERARMALYSCLLSDHYDREFAERCDVVHKKFNHICEMWLPLRVGSYIRQKYVRKYIYKEIEFISNFYYKKNNKSGKEIHKKITGIQDGLIRHMMNLYLLLKKNNYMIKFYQFQTEFLDSRIKSAQLLSLEL